MNFRETVQVVLKKACFYRLGSLSLGSSECYQYQG